jgi:hypothetical protein
VALGRNYVQSQVMYSTGESTYRFAA